MIYSLLVFSQKKSEKKAKVFLRTCMFRACLHRGGGPQIGEVIRLGGIKNNPPLHVILQPRHPGVHVFKITEWSLST